MYARYFILTLSRFCCCCCSTLLTRWGCDHKYDGGFLRSIHILFVRAEWRIKKKEAKVSSPQWTLFPIFFDHARFPHLINFSFNITQTTSFGRKNWNVYMNIGVYDFICSLSAAIFSLLSMIWLFLSLSTHKHTNFIQMVRKRPSQSVPTKDNYSEWWIVNGRGN